MRARATLRLFPGAAEASFAIAAILMALTLCINLAAALAGRYFKKRSAL